MGATENWVQYIPIVVEENDDEQWIFSGNLFSEKPSSLQFHIRFDHRLCLSM
jgi:phenylpyruvate tautomerase PptA (4-oxalocrotonate tautomerase family)